ncbi:MAG: hypothetical protein RLZZ210_456 [Pseudomonadota bacterium]|jgi:uncharacterized BrkB/YihY/UPF0761 family membrane protein
MLSFVSKKINKLRTFGQLVALDMILASTANAQTAPTNATNIQGFIGNMTSAMGSIQTAIVALSGLVGLGLVANSLNNLYKASKDPSHQVKPMSGAIGLIIGGLLSAIATVVTLSKNSSLGA